MVSRSYRGRGRGRGAKSTPVKNSFKNIDIGEEHEGLEEDISVNGVPSSPNEYESTSKFSRVSAQSEKETVREPGRSHWKRENSSTGIATEEQESNDYSEHNLVNIGSTTDDSTIECSTEESIDQHSSKTGLNVSSSKGGENDPEIQFTVDDTELAEFDAEDVDENRQSGLPKHYEEYLKNRKILASKAHPAAVGSSSSSAVSNNGTGNLKSILKNSSTESPSSMKMNSPTKKVKRKFGLEYIVVSVAQSVSGEAPPSMRNSPHECVLCLPEQSFTATILAKHIHSAEHLKKVMALHLPSLHEALSDCQDADELHAELCDTMPEPEQPIKLLVVTEDKLRETRSRIMSAIVARRQSVSTCSKNDARSKFETVRDKRPLKDTDKFGAGEPSLKRPKTEQLQHSDQGVFEEDSGKSVLLVGDQRAQKLSETCPALAEMSTLAFYPHARLQQILAGALMRLNSSYKVVIVVTLLNDFVYERDDKGTKRLMMVNPNMNEIKQAVSRFASSVRNINPSIKIIMTIPSYIDFIQYHKRVKLLRPADFSRYEDFSNQVLKAFKELYETFRYMAKNMFCFNMNITLRDASYQTMSNPRRPPGVAAQMQYLPGTLEDGFHLSEAALRRVADDITARADKMVRAIQAYAPEADPNMIECWSDCDNILIVGDHLTFKFESSAPPDMVKNVTLVTEKFGPILKLLKTADKMLNDSVDLLVIVGFYREFAQNVINGRFTILEPQVPVKQEIFGLLQSFRKRWEARFPRLTVVFTIPQVVDFLKYNVANNPGIPETPQFVNQMDIYSHQFSINIMSFYKELRPALTLGSRRVWLYHITNSLYEGHSSLLQTLGNFNVRPQFPPNSTFDGFKPNQATSARMRTDLVVYVTKLLRKNPVERFKRRE